MVLQGKHILYALSCMALFMHIAGCVPTPPMAETLNDNLNAYLMGLDNYYMTDPNTAIRWNRGFGGNKQLTNENSIIHNNEV